MVKKGTVGTKNLDRLQVPIFYKLMVSMLIVAAIPIFLLSFLSINGSEVIVETLGVTGTIVVLTLVTLVIVLALSFVLAKSITSPIEQLSSIAQNMSQGEIEVSEIDVTSNDEIGELVRSFNKLINTYIILDTLAKDDVSSKQS
jgi:HAMP domain-containing protein